MTGDSGTFREHIRDLLTFAGIKDQQYFSARENICRMIEESYNKFDFLTKGDLLNAKEKEYYSKVTASMDDSAAAVSLRNLSDYLYRYYGQKVIILLDEYDTPMQEAYVNGYWEQLAAFTRSLFNYTFKTNPYLERALMTGITRVSKESIFSDLNNIKVVTTTTDMYETSFGFYGRRSLSALDEFQLTEQKEEVKAWYDGFKFGNQSDIYNPWSVLNFLMRENSTVLGEYEQQQLVGKLIREGSTGIKEDFQSLSDGGSVVTEIDEQIVYHQLDLDERAIWSLLLAAGYLKVKTMEICQSGYEEWKQLYTLELTNFEVKVMFQHMVRGWFASAASSYHGFLQALLTGDLEAMNAYMNRVARGIFSYFDTAGDSDMRNMQSQNGFTMDLFWD